ncbi:MAG: hypothetical protein AAGA77_16025 [Bacteroidota bacterium]
MKNRLYILTVAIGLILSCGETVETEKSRFRSFIGIDEFQQLENFMKAMETKFMETYEVNTINDAYNSYTINKVLGKSHLVFNEKDCRQLEMINESGLIDKHAQFKYDTVYQEGNLIVTIHKKDTSWLVKPPEKYEGEYKEKVESEGFRIYLHINELYEGIQFANKQDTLIEQIVETRKQIGYLNTERLTEEIHLKRVDYEQNYLYRVLICMETYLNELKEYGC